MFVYKKSSFSLLVVLVSLIFTLSAWGQQRANDFTKKVRSMDSRLSALSSKRLSSGRMHDSFDKRIKVAQWPSTFSSFGSRRFPIDGKELMGAERVPFTRLEIETPLNQTFSSANTERVRQSDLGERSAAVASIEFRDAYYAELDKRVDDWMNKVNNLSLRDVNRFQFRKNRPSEPGFPVQRAGSDSLPASADNNSLGRPSLRGVGPPAVSRGGVPKESYWMGPKKIEAPARRNKPSSSSSRRSLPTSPEKNFKSYPKPLFGPKKVRVDIK